LLQAIKVSYEYEDLILARKVTGGQTFELEVATANDYVAPAKNEDIVVELKALRFQDLKEQAIALMREGRELEARELIEKAGKEFEQLLDEMQYMSSRNRTRMSAQQSEFMHLSQMSDSGEFMKRGTESLNRGRRSKPDPRKES
jgi:NCAIR mutase (PurE)-related protein